MSYISILQPIAAAKAQLGIIHSTEDHYLLMQAVHAETIIASNFSIVRQVVEVDIVDNIAEMPADLYSLRALRFIGDTDCTYPKYARQSFFKSSTDSPNTYAKYIDQTFDFEDGYIYFSSAVTATKCEIEYDGFNIDDDGYPKIHESHEIAITNYICWKYALKDHFSFPMNVRKDYEREWKFRCQRARNDSRMPNPIEREYLIKIWNNRVAHYNFKK